MKKNFLIHLCSLLLWFLIIAVGLIIERKANPESRYIIGFVFGCLSVGILYLIEM